MKQKVQIGKVIKVKTFQGIKTVELDNGYKFDTHKDIQVNDNVKVTPYIMGTILVEKIG